MKGVRAVQFHLQFRHLIHRGFGFEGGRVGFGFGFEGDRVGFGLGVNLVKVDSEKQQSWLACWG